MRRGNVERKKNEKRRKTMKRTDIKKKYWEDKIRKKGNINKEKHRDRT